MKDQRDPILDACLEEVLGGQRPPDLTPRILQAIANLPPAIAKQPGPVDAPPVAPARPVIPPMPPGSTRPRASAFGLSLAAAATVIGIVGGLGYLAMHLATPGPRGVPIAESPGEQHAEFEFAPRGRDEEVPRLETPAPPERPSSPAEPGSRPDSPAPRPAVSDTAGPRPATRERSPVVLPTLPAPHYEPKSDADIVASIDASLAAKWRVAGVSPAGTVDDAEVCQRLYRQVLGREPTPPELLLYVQDSSRDKRTRLVDRLLTDEAYVEEFARAWSRYWADTLVGPQGSGLANGASREGLEQFLRRALLEEKAFDQVAVELLTATGAGQPGAEDYNGAANFLIAHYDKDGVRAAAHASRALLGRQLACAQCHDHPTDAELAQTRFWEWNAFFRQLAVKRDNPAAAQLVDIDFHGAASGDSSDAEVFYETPQGELRVAYPALPEVAALPHDGLLADFDRREFLARYVAQSMDFNRAVVNRIWGALLGAGFTSPVDEMGPGNPPSHPDLLEGLAEQFAAHGHDLKSLVRWIALSRPFTLPSGDSTAVAADLPAAGGMPLFSRFYPQPSRAISTIDSLELVAQTLRNPAADPVAGTAARLNPLTNQSPRIPDGLAPPISPLTGLPSFDFDRAATGNTIAAILDSDLDRDAKVEHLFWATVHRSPQRRELARVKEMFEQGTSERATLQAVWWALSRSGEVQLQN